MKAIRSSKHITYGQ